MAGNPCELRAIYTDRAPRIDGYIEEDIWANGALATHFTMRTPNPGGTPTERTGVRLLYDRNNLYILFICSDSDPDLIVANTMRRDQPMSSEDYIAIYIDSMHDHRTVFYFQTNTLGARRDALVTAEGQNYNDDWDGIWNSKTRVTSQGWVAEFVIPLSTLRYNTGNNQTWGINFSRAVSRKREYMYWTPITTPRSREYYKAQLYGHLTNLQLTRSPKAFQIKPYALGGWDKDYAAGSAGNITKSGGVDVKYGLTNQLTLDLTYNTDFAQVESDQEVVNLSRFNLFFPEKREFFLEGAGIFDLSINPISGSADSRDMLLFHSRTIGLYKRYPVSLLGGARLTGKVGDYDIGLLNITADKDRIPTDEVVPRTNFSVLRARRAIAGRSEIGAMYTQKMVENSGDDNKAVGFDTNLYFPANIRYSGYFARSFTPGKSGSANSMYSSFGWDGVYTYGHISGLRIEKNFNPEMGFIERDDINRMRVEVGGGPRIYKYGLRTITGGLSYRYTSDQAFSMLDRYEVGSLRIDFLNRNRITFSGYTSFVYLPEAVKISGLTIPEGEYEGGRYTIGYGSNTSKPVYVSASYRGGTYYDGTLKGFTGSVGLNLFHKLQMRISNSFNRREAMGQVLKTNVLSQFMTFSFTPDLFVRSSTQWNNGTDRLLVNFLLRYTYMPGSDLNIVFNETYETDDLMYPGIRYRKALLKLTYLL